MANPIPDLFAANVRELQRLLRVKSAGILRSLNACVDQWSDFAVTHHSLLALYDHLIEEAEQALKAEAGAAP